VARKLAPNHRVICAAPSYLEKAGIPKTLAELSRYNCLAPAAQEVWRLQGPEGPASVRASGSIRTNSTEVVREAVLAGLGIALRSTWDVGPELKSGRLKVILPEYHESPRVAVYAVYPCRQYVPAKLRVFVDFLAGLFGPEPYWDKGLALPFTPQARATNGAAPAL
ncbi:MAG: substrate binding domain-containing protein, partial [Hyphomicrobiales bacterium]